MHRLQGLYEPDFLRGAEGGRTAMTEEYSVNYLDYTVGEFLEALADRQPAPSGGAAAALTVATAAALTAMAARFAAAPELVALAEQADELRFRALQLADADALAYAEVLAAKREPDTAARDRLTAAWRVAAEMPLAVARAGVRVVELAARLEATGNPNLAGDARTAVLLAQASVRAASELVGINVRAGGLDGAPLAEARAHVRAAESAGHTP